MKVFEVVTEHCRENNKIETMRQYVTAENDSLQLVAQYFTAHCTQYDEELKSITEVATIVQHIKKDPAP